MAHLFSVAAMVASAVLVVNPVAAQSDSLPTIKWRDGGKIPIARDHHATFTITSGSDTYLYVVGGTNYKEMYAHVAGARILPSGRLGSWQEGPALPFARGGSSAIATDKAVVVTGGQIDTLGALRGLQRISDVLVAEVLPGGQLGAWRSTTPLPRPRFHHPMIVHNGWIYVVGGQGEKEAESGVFAARLGEDGAINAWIEQRPLPRPRSHHAAFVADDHLYVVGGLDGVVAAHNAHFFDVIRAEILTDGSIGEWRIVSRVPIAHATHAAFAHRGFLWIVGGVENGSQFSDAIWRAPIGADQRIGAWVKLTDVLPFARGHVHNTPVVNGRIYSAGGRIAAPSPVVDAVHIGELKE